MASKTEPLRLKWRKDSSGELWLKLDGEIICVADRHGWLIFSEEVCGVRLKCDHGFAGSIDASILVASKRLVKQLRAVGVKASIERTSR